LFKQAGARVSTGDLNRVVQEALAEQSPPLRHNRRPKIFYATQVATYPPTIILMTNGPELFDPTYLRYLLKTFRDRLPFRDISIKLHLRHKHSGGRGPTKPEGGADEGRSSIREQKPRKRITPAKARKAPRAEVWKDI
jgi:GTP-binding protein